MAHYNLPSRIQCEGDPPLYSLIDPVDQFSFCNAKVVAGLSANLHPLTVGQIRISTGIGYGDARRLIFYCTEGICYGIAIDDPLYVAQENAILTAAL